MNDIPNFAAWTNENLARFAKDSYVRMQEQQKHIEELQLNLKDAVEIMKEVKRIFGPLND